MTVTWPLIWGQEIKLYFVFISKSLSHWKSLFSDNYNGRHLSRQIGRISICKSCSRSRYKNFWHRSWWQRKIQTTKRSQWWCWKRFLSRWFFEFAAKDFRTKSGAVWMFWCIPRFLQRKASFKTEWKYIIEFSAP